MNQRIINIAAYKFVNLHDCEQWQEQFYTAFADMNVMGTILLAPEGINLMLAGEPAAIEQARIYLISLPEFADLEFKDTESAAIPFERFRVKVKAEIVPMGSSNVKPVCYTGPEISAQELKQWLDEERDFTLLDTRNDYEIELGTFEKAVDWNIHSFRDFAGAADKVSAADKQKPLVMFCTGGIRCEKASALLLQEKGFKDVYQLQGGIIKYFQEIGGEHYKGSCFVFDFRTAITPDCEETGLTQCEQCQEFVTQAEQLKTQYKRGDQCIHCMPGSAAA
jgi:predicted sulfurtransferase